MSLTRDDLEDIQQLMEATISAALAVAFQEQREYIDKRFDEVDARFEEVDARFDEVDARFEEVLDAVGTRFNEQEERLDSHEVRIVRLEKHAA